MTLSESHWWGEATHSGELQRVWQSVISSYLSSSEVKAGSSEMWRFPGIGFSSCAVPTFSRLQGISNGGYESSFRNVPEQRKCARTNLSTSAKAGVMEVLSLEFRGMRNAQNVPE